MKTTEDNIDESIKMFEERARQFRDELTDELDNLDNNHELLRPSYKRSQSLRDIRAMCNSISYHILSYLKLCSDATHKEGEDY